MADLMRQDCGELIVIVYPLDQALVHIDEPAGKRNGVHLIVSGTLKV
jgi:hypothetical protein